MNVSDVCQEPDLTVLVCWLGCNAEVVLVARATGQALRDDGEVLKRPFDRLFVK